MLGPGYSLTLTITDYKHYKFQIWDRFPSESGIWHLECKRGTARDLSVSERLPDHDISVAFASLYANTLKRAIDYQVK
jgi:hypothetical protein